ncbi:MAG: toll/interleukin-1 receptor domain-containing protein [Tildeniella nuda ZEHNDER 1965/U140]|jgi:hypothetical protein|nr:toll/interleukin-1 receptor domain-containing protein [Tildeniella nuda ZEHNDER 1965/U140]
MANVPQIFICYAHQDNESTDPDKRWLDRLLVYLRPLEQQGELQLWSDQQLEIGDTWDREIKDQLHHVKAAVLLVSQALLGSKYVKNTELPVLLKRAQDDGVRIVSIVVRDCQIDTIRFKYPDPQTGPEALSLSVFQTANPPSKPLNSLTEHEQDKIFRRVADYLWHLVQSEDSHPPDT